MRILSKEEIENRFKDHLTIGDLKKWLDKNSDLPDDSKVLIQRVDDRYFKNNQWGVYLKDGETVYNQLNFNNDMREEIERRENGEESEYPAIEYPSNLITEITDDLREQYFPAWCCVRYSDEEKIMFIDAFY